MSDTIKDAIYFCTSLLGFYMIYRKIAEGDKQKSTRQGAFETEVVLFRNQLTEMLRANTESIKSLERLIEQRTLTIERVSAEVKTSNKEISALIERVNNIEKAHQNALIKNVELKKDIEALKLRMEEIRKEWKTELRG